MSQISVPLDLATGAFPATFPASLDGTSLNDRDWADAVSGLNVILSRNDAFNGQMVASLTICCIMLLDLPLLALLVWSQLGQWFDNWYENYFLWACLLSSVLMLPLLSYMRRSAQNHEMTMRVALTEANVNLLSKSTQIVLVEDPQCVLALQVLIGVTQVVIDPLQLGTRRYGRSYAGQQGSFWAPGGVARGQPYSQRQVQDPNSSGGVQATVMGTPVSLPPGATVGRPVQQAAAPPPTQQHMLTIQIPPECEPGQTFQFMNPSNGQVMQAQRPMDGATVVQVQA